MEQYKPLSSHTPFLLVFLFYDLALPNLHNFLRQPLQLVIHRLHLVISLLLLWFLLYIDLLKWPRHSISSTDLIQAKSFHQCKYRDRISTFTALWRNDLILLPLNRRKTHAFSSGGRDSTWWILLQCCIKTFPLLKELRILICQKSPFSLWKTSRLLMEDLLNLLLVRFQYAPRQTLPQYLLLMRCIPSCFRSLNRTTSIEEVWPFSFLLKHSSTKELSVPLLISLSELNSSMAPHSHFSHLP